MSCSTRSRRSIGFTIIELLVVISIIALLVGILLPAISRARDGAKLTQSAGNLKNLGTAHQVYAAEWNDRQFTLVRDDLGAQVDGVDSYPVIPGFQGSHPPIILGWGSEGGLWAFWFNNLPTNSGLLWPLNPHASSRMGWFRIPNARQFSQYVNGRFYDPVFYAPKDKIPIEAVGEFFDYPGEFVSPPASIGTLPWWSSYSLSPAALFNPRVLTAFSGDLTHSWNDPAHMPSGFKVPSMSQARFPSLKTHMLEHHWLQGARGISCNPWFLPGPGDYRGCVPYFFNLAFESAPVTLFFDGSVRSMGVSEATLADSQSTSTGGLYLRPQHLVGAGALAGDGYWLDTAFDGLTQATNETGYHVLTRNGILGRDTLGSN